MEATTSRSIPCAQTIEARDEFLKTLPRLSATDLHTPEDHCPICLNPFSAILGEGHVDDEYSIPNGRSGITKLQCGHIFCMADIAEWIHTLRGSCPTCRDLFLVIPEPSDDESSDEEYIPGSDSVVDDMMDEETWTDEDGETWTDGEGMSLDEGITEGETDSSWERSSEGAMDDIDAESLPAAGQLAQTSMDTAVITEADSGISLAVPHEDPECEQIKTELIQWRAQIDHIQIQDWPSNRDETRSKIVEGFRALRSLKPRVDALDRDTSAKVSFVHSALAAMHDMESKLEIMHDIDSLTRDTAS